MPAWEAVVGDPHFRTPAAWTITPSAGSAAVSNGTLTLTGFEGLIESVGAPIPASGVQYVFELECTSCSGAGIAELQYADTYLWANDMDAWGYDFYSGGGDGVGIFSGGFIAGTSSLPGPPPLALFGMAVYGGAVSAVFTKMSVVRKHNDGGSFAR